MANGANKTKEAADILIQEADKLEAAVEIVFMRDEITVYWHSLRLDVTAKELPKALSLLKQLEKFGARFE